MGAKQVQTISSWICKPFFLWGGGGGGCKFNVRDEVILGNTLEMSSSSIECWLFLAYQFQSGPEHSSVGQPSFRKLTLDLEAGFGDVEGEGYWNRRWEEKENRSA